MKFKYLNQETENPQPYKTPKRAQTPRSHLATIRSAHIARAIAARSDADRQGRDSAARWGPMGLQLAPIGASSHIDEGKHGS